MYSLAYCKPVKPNNAAMQWKLVIHIITSGAFYVVMIIHLMCMVITSYNITGINSPAVLFGTMELLYWLWVIYKYLLHLLMIGRNLLLILMIRTNIYTAYLCPPTQCNSPFDDTRSACVTGMNIKVPKNHLSYLIKAAAAITCCFVVLHLLVTGILFYKHEDYFSYLISVCVVVASALLTGMTHIDCNKQVILDTGSQAKQSLE